MDSRGIRCDGLKRCREVKGDPGGEDGVRRDKTNRWTFGQTTYRLPPEEDSAVLWFSVWRYTVKYKLE